MPNNTKAQILTRHMYYMRKLICYIGSQKKVAEYLNVHPSKVWNWVNNERKVPIHIMLLIEAGTQGKIALGDFEPQLLAQINALNEKPFSPGPLSISSKKYQEALKTAIISEK